MSNPARRKGNKGELEAAALFNEYGHGLRRTPNSGGLAWRGDLQGMEGYVFEVKRQERLDVPAWLRQVYAAARGGEIPVLLFRRNRTNPTDPLGRWHAVLPAEELARLFALEKEAR